VCSTETFIRLNETVHSDFTFMCYTELYVPVYTLCLRKNAPTLACASFELHGLILIIFWYAESVNQNNYKNNVCTVFNFQCASTFTNFIGI